MTLVDQQTARTVYMIDFKNCVKLWTVNGMFAAHAESRGFDSHWRHMSERFFQSNRPGYPHPMCSELEIVGSEWQLVIAVSMNVRGGVRLIKRAQLYICMQKHNKPKENGGMVPGVRNHGLFTIIPAWGSSWSCNPTHLYKFSVPFSHKFSYEIWFQMT